jgi:hypothetical protein
MIVNVARNIDECAKPIILCLIGQVFYSEVQKSVPVKLARLLPYITIGCWFDPHPRIDSVLRSPGLRYGLLQNVIGSNA